MTLEEREISKCVVFAIMHGTGAEGLMVCAQMLLERGRISPFFIIGSFSSVARVDGTHRDCSGGKSFCSDAVGQETMVVWSRHDSAFGCEVTSARECADLM